jgi:hypothetical protein
VRSRFPDMDWEELATVPFSIREQVGLISRAWTLGTHLPVRTWADHMGFGGQGN